MWALEYRKKTLVEVRKLREDLVRAEVDRDRHQNARAQAERLSRGRYEALEALLGSDGVEVARQLVEDGMPYGDAAVAAQRLTAPKGVTR